MSAPPAPPDEKDWTWVLSSPCPECGFDAATTPPDSVAGRLRALIPAYAAALAAPNAPVRPEPTTWSAVEYGCHVRDVCRVFTGRVELTLAEDDPVFANWDQDATAIEEQYAVQDPAVVTGELATAAEELARTLDAVHPDQWDRPARRSNGSAFTLGTLTQYLLHDLAHHAWDVGHPVSE